MKTFGIILLIMLVIFGLGAKAFLDHASPEHEHSYGEWTTKTPATCTEAGVEVRACECSDEETREIPATGHTYGEWETKTPANCTDAEVEARKCACGAEETREGDAALGHSFTEQVATEEYLATANCGAKATYYVSCACGAKGEDTFEHGDILPHDYYVAEVFMPNCTEGGYSTYKCRTCDDSYVGDELPANGHTYGAIVTEPKCTEAGYTRYQCTCGDYYIADEVAALGHNMVAMSDDTHHWTECDRYCCPEATDKVAHIVNKISVGYTESEMMEHKVLTPSDFEVTATCTCDKEFTVTEGIEVINGTLIYGWNIVTVKVGDVSMEMLIHARPFSVAVGGHVKEDTYVYSASGSQDKNYATQPELSANGDNFRVLLKYNFNDVINNIYYNDHKDEATIEFVFTMTTGTVDETTKLTFKAYPVDAVRSGASFDELTWKNYDATYGFGWGKADGFVNKEAGSPYVTIADDGHSIIITLTYREIEQYIDENGDALFVLGIWKSGTKIGSIDNENDNVRPRWTVHFSNEHTHAYIEKVVDEKYLASANCGEKAKYYMSCSCGEAGTKTFEHGEVIEHVFSEWATKSAADCLNAEVEFRTCHCGKEETQTGDVALGHDMQTKYDITNHWTECSRCDEATDPVAHFGGEATETEQAICEGCGQPYGGLATHEHSFGEWESFSPATCDKDEVLIHYCDCGVSETSKGAAAFGHDMQTKFDENNHWTECAHNCGASTDAVAHFGGEATETEQAICEGCNQPYGGLKEAPKQEYTINATVKDDTYVMSGNNESKNYASATELNVNANGTCRVLFRVNFSEILASADYNADPNARVRLTFSLTTSGALDKASTVTLKAYNPSETRTAIDFSTLTWKNYNTAPNDLGWGTDVVALVSEGYGDKVAYDSENGKVTITISYSDIVNCMDDNNDVLFVFAIKQSSTKIASMEHKTEALRPKVEYVYEK